MRKIAWFTLPQYRIHYKHIYLGVYGHNIHTICSRVCFLAVSMYLYEPVMLRGRACEKEFAIRMRSKRNQKQATHFFSAFGKNTECIHFTTNVLCSMGSRLDKFAANPERYQSNRKQEFRCKRRGCLSTIPANTVECVVKICKITEMQ